MAMNDVALQALLNYQNSSQQRKLERYRALPQIVPEAVNMFATLDQAQQKLDLAKQEAAARYGAQPSVRAPMFGGSARPGEIRVTPGRVGGAVAAADLPEEMLTGRPGRALQKGGDVFYTPGRVGLDEMRTRAGLLSNVMPANVSDFLIEPDRSLAFAGTEPRVKPPKIPTSKEGDALMDVATTIQLYRDEGLTDEQIKKAPQRLKARDYKVRRQRLNAKSRGSLFDVLMGVAAGGGAAPAAGAGGSAGDSVAGEFGF